VSFGLQMSVLLSIPPAISVALVQLAEIKAYWLAVKTAMLPSCSLLANLPLSAQNP
jgi:hypothetical protein